MNSPNLPVVQAIQEADYLIAASRDMAGMGKVMKFDNGEYYIGDDVVPIGTEFIVYCNEWIQRWVKFGPDGFEDSRIYVISRGQKAVDRTELGDNDKELWPPSRFNDGKPRDPWVLQDLIPFESRETGEILTFRNTSEYSGRWAIKGLCLQYANMKKRDAQAANGAVFNARSPIIRIGKDSYINKKFGGKKPFPVFEIIGWDVSGPADAMDIRRETGDEVPF